MRFKRNYKIKENNFIQESFDRVFLMQDRIKI